ncbi:MAG: HYR domain-containing protein [Verrucomicrobiota bacterium]
MEHSIIGPVEYLANRSPKSLSNLQRGFAGLLWCFLFVIQLQAETYQWVGLAGNGGGAGAADDVAGAARFYLPKGTAVDASGNVYVADYGNCVIRKVTPSGGVTTFAGSFGLSGNVDGTGSAARFGYVSGLAVDASGTVYVADQSNHTIRAISPSGVVTTLAGAAGVYGSADGTGSGARFNSPSGVVADSAGNLYVTDYGNHTVRKITAGGVVSTLAGTTGSYGAADGLGGQAQFFYPGAIAVDLAGDVYVADTMRHTIRKVTGAGLVTTIAGSAGNSGSSDGAGNQARFYNPSGLCVDSGGNVYVSDQNNQTVRKITSSGVVTTLAGLVGWNAGTDGTGSAARFYSPAGLSVDGNGVLYLADMLNHTIRKMTSNGVVVTLAGRAVSAGAVDATGGAATFYSPNGLALDSNANVYVADQDNHVIRKITAAGVVSTLAGSAGNVGSANGTGSLARFNSPKALAVDSAGNVYVADQGSHTVRKITAAGVVSTLAGSAGVSGSSDGVGGAARFASPASVAVDASGTVFVADYANHTVRKIASGGGVQTFAGSAGVAGSGDGVGSVARFCYPSAVALDGNGSVYVADGGNHTIRKITASGLVSTVAGSAGHAGSADGVGAAALFENPTALGVDGAGDVYVADAGNHTVRKITSAGLVTTLGGLPGYASDYPALGLNSRFAVPRGLAVSSSGAVYVSNSATHNVVRGTSVAVGDITVEQPAGTGLDGRGAGVVSWGLMEVGVSMTRTFVVRNDGIASLALGSFSVTGVNAGDFVVSAQPGVSALAPGQDTTFAVKFTPGATGGRLGTLHLPSDDPDEADFVITLAGTGNQAPVAAPGGPYFMTIGQSLTLSGAASSDPDSPYGDGVASYQWDIQNDGSYEASGSNPTISWNVLNAVLNPVSYPLTATIRLKVTDSFGGQSGEQTTTLTIYDDTIHPDFTTSASVVGQRVVVSLNAAPTSQGDPRRSIVNYTWDFADGTTYSAATTQTFGHTFANVGTYNVRLTATNDLGASASVIHSITVTDTTAPVIQIPPNVTASAIDASGAAVSYLAPTATDNVGVTVLQASQASGSLFPIGTTTVTVTAKDAANNTSSGSFTVTVIDTTPPVLSGIPANVVVEATSASGAPVSYIMPTASDNVGVVSLSTSAPSGTIFPLGTTTVTFSVADAANNTCSGAFTVTVRDTTMPVISGVPANLSVQADSLNGAVVNYVMPTVTDNVGVVSLNAMPQSGSVFPFGTTTVTITAKDAANNISNASFTVNVSDATAPIMNGVPANILAEATSASGAVVTYTMPTASDNVGVTSLTASPVSGSLFPFGTTTVTITAKDALNNTSTATFTVTVRDNTAPLIRNMPANITVEAASLGGAVANYTMPTATDNVGVTSLSTSKTSGSLFPLGVTTVTITAKDAAENISTATFTVTVLDTTKPVVSGIFAPLVLNTNAAGKVVLPDYTNQATVSDNVEVVSVSQEPAAGTLVDAGLVSVKVIATDGAQNRGVALFNVEVREFPRILIQPEDVYVRLKANVVLSVKARGYGALGYQWKKDGVALTGATGASLSLKGIQANDLGNYAVVVTNTIGSVESEPAQVHFVDLKVPAGVYQGLLVHDKTDITAMRYPGRVSFTLSNTGALSGRLRYRGGDYPFIGSLNPVLRFTTSILRKGQGSLEFALVMDPVTYQWSTQVVETESKFTSEGLLSEEPTYTLKDPAPQTGRYTVVFNPDETVGTGPEVAGYASIMVAPSGAVLVAGRLPDGTSLNTAAHIQGDGSVCVFNCLYEVGLVGGGYLGGVLKLDGGGGVGAVTGELEWSKPVQKGLGLWMQGFLQRLKPEGGVYVAVPETEAVMDGGAFVLTLGRDDLMEPVPVTLTPERVFTVAVPSGSITLSFRDTGVVSGVFVDGASKKTHQLEGVVLQSEGRVRGFYTRESDAVEWTLEKPPVAVGSGNP